MKFNINTVLAAHFVFFIFFDVFPPVAQDLISSILYFLYAIIVYKTSIFNDRRRGSELIVVFIIMGMPWIASYMFTDYSSQKNLFSLAAGFRNIFALVVGVAILQSARWISIRLLTFFALFIVCYATLFSFILPEIQLGGSTRIAWFTSNLHSSAYAVSICCIYFSWLWFKKPRLVYAVALALSAILLFRYGVRTSWILAGVPLVLVISRWVRNSMGLGAISGTLVQVAAALILGGVGVFFLPEADIIDQVSSGRISNYLERWAFIDQWNLGAILFGLGPGSDSLVAEVWGGDARDAHSDILHFFWETGAVGLVLVSYVIFAFRRYISGSAHFIWCGLFVVSFVSNAILSRPNVAVLIFAVMAIISVYRDISLSAKDAREGKSVGEIASSRSPRLA